MLTGMHGRIAAVLLTLAALSAPVTALAAPSRPVKRKTPPSRRHRAPTRAQIASAVKDAKHSPDLWATVNVCNTPAHPNTIGLRGQMPSLGFAATETMQIQASYWSFADGKFLPDPGVVQTVDLGTIKHGLQQGGASFAFQPHAGNVSGFITFRWLLGRRVVGLAIRTAVLGHPEADFGDPPHYSSFDCVMP